MTKIFKLNRKFIGDKVLIYEKDDLLYELSSKFSVSGQKMIFCDVKEKSAIFTFKQQWTLVKEIYDIYDVGNNLVGQVKIGSLEDHIYFDEKNNIRVKSLFNNKFKIQDDRMTLEKLKESFYELKILDFDSIGLPILAALALIVKINLSSG
jgi:hypothetical protein